MDGVEKAMERNATQHVGSLWRSQSSWQRHPAQTGGNSASLTEKHNTSVGRPERSEACSSMLMLRTSIEMGELFHCFTSSPRCVGGPTGYASGE